VGVTGGDMTVSAGGAVSARAAGGVELGAASVLANVAGGATGGIGGSASLAVGGDVSVESSGRGAATFGEGVSVSGGSVSVESAGDLTGAARAVEVLGTEGVRVGSVGATVELSGSGEVEYVGYVWRSSGSFDEFANAVPLLTDVEEVVVRSVAAGGARVVSAGGTQVNLEVDSGASGWGRVWGTTVGAGTYSLDGLHARFEKRDVVGVRLGSSPWNGPSFEGWGEVVLHFGRVVGAGAVKVASSSVLDAVAGEAVRVSSASVTVAAGKEVLVSGGEAVGVTTAALRVLASDRLEAYGGEVEVASASGVTVMSGGAVSVTSATVAVDAAGDVSLASGAGVSVTGV
jgi:hypothetical protein